MTVLRLGLVAFVAVIVQSTLFAELRIEGVAPELPFLLAVLAGFTAGPDRGAMFGFAIGLLYDVLLPSPLGVAALAAAVVAYLVGAFQQSLMQSSWWLPYVGSGLMSAAALGLFALTAEVFGQRGYVNGDLPFVLLLVGLLGTAMSPMCRWLVAWCYGGDDLRTGTA